MSLQKYNRIKQSYLGMRGTQTIEVDHMMLMHIPLSHNFKLITYVLLKNQYFTLHFENNSLILSLD